MLLLILVCLDDSALPNARERKEGMFFFFFPAPVAQRAVLPGHVCDRRPAVMPLGLAVQKSFVYNPQSSSKPMRTPNKTRHKSKSVNFYFD